MRAEGTRTESEGTGVARRAQVVLGLAVLVAFALASSSPSQGAPGAKPPDFDKAAAALEKHGDNWLDKPGVVGVGIGVNNAGKAVIHVYKVKDDDEGIPSDVDGVAVAQVRTGRFDPRAAPTDRWPRPVPIGISSGLADFATGTLGARVTDGTNVYALSNNHVFAGVNTASIGDPITQPGPDDGGSDPGDRIATLAEYQAIDFNGGDNTMDAAIALTSAGDVGTATPPDGYGAPSTTPTAASIGMGVQKYGRTTGLQLGTVQDISLMVDVCYFPLGEFCFPGYEARFVNQISVSPGTFSAPGDSGSLMVTQGGNQPVALLFAGDGSLTIGNPIIPVLQRFNVTIEGGPPVSGPPTAPTNLRATAGDARVALAWNAPAFDGGSSITGYRVYRGPSPGGETLLPTPAITSTSYTDATAVNGTTYYYKVSAVNANGEGPLSNGASATPVALVTPAAPLTILDGFNRPNENPLSDQGRWSNSIVAGENGHNVTSNQLACSVTTTCTAWRNNAQYGPDVEVYARLSTLPGANNQLRLYARLQLPGQNGYLMWANQLSGTDEVWLDRFTGGAGIRLLTISQELTAGDVMLLRVHGTSIEAWRHNGTAWSRLGVVQDATHGSAGYVGVGLRGTTGRVDDFGARGLGPSSPPGVPTTLSAAPGDARVALAWNAPAFDGGSSITGYRVYRGPSPGGETLLPTPAITSTSYTDATAVNGTTYYYKVSAVNANGEGPLSNGASATPVALVTPAAPLTILDGFNRPNENPLSDQGRWSNSIVAGENGHNVTSNQLACSVTTTCTAWRNNAQYGPDVEVYARLSTLPGANNQLRLYARLQLPGQNGYLMWANQLSGTDEVWLDRFTGGAGIRLLTISQELTAGDVMLLRVHGTSIEAWRHNGTAWSRLGVVQDATHGSAGYVGVGLRGTTGRVDDFGARGLGGPPPDTTPPSAPGTLSATTSSSTRIDLTWGPATDDAAVAGYRIERCEGVSCSNFSQIATTTTATSYSDTGLSPSTSYTYRVRAEDTATPIHNLGPYSNLDSATTQAPPDTEPPSAPGILSANAVSSTEIDLSWQAASDNVAVTSYRIERCQGAGCSGPDFTEIATTAGLSFQNTGLTPSTSYSYRVRAEDAATNTGAYSNIASQSTPAPPDTEPPGAPGTLTASAVSSTRIDLFWGSASDNFGVSLYRLERCTGVGCSIFTEIATTAGLSFQNTGLTPSTSYSYRVRAEDAATNTGPYSNVASQSTLSSIVPPVEPLPVLDGFNRTNENPLSDSDLWSNGVAGPSEAGLRVASNALACTKNSTCSAWRGTTQYGPDVEVYARVATLPGRNHEVRLLARVQQPGSSAYDGYMLRAIQRNGTDEVRLDRVDNGAITGMLTMPRELAAGDVLLLRVVGSRLEAWTRRGAAWSLLGAVDDSTYSAAGSVGVGTSGKTCRLDDFGAR